jgi:hypothetical protein
MLLNPGWGRRLGKAGRARALRLYDEKHVIAAQIKRINTEVASLRSNYGGLQG